MTELLEPRAIGRDLVRRDGAAKVRGTATYAYESVLVLAEALKQTAGEADGLPEALTSIKNLEGVQGTISINEYGDVERDSYIAIIKDRQFAVIEVISPTD